MNAKDEAVCRLLDGLREFWHVASWGVLVAVAACAVVCGAAVVHATAVTVPWFTEGAAVTARPVVVEEPDVISAELVDSGKVNADGTSQGVMWLEVVQVIPSNEIDLATGLPKPDRAIRYTYTGPWGQTVVLKETEEGVRYQDTVVPGEIQFGE